MFKLILVIFLFSIHTLSFSQKSADSCFSTPKTNKAYIENTDSISIKLSDLKKGFNLLTTNADFKIVKFCVAYIDEATTVGTYYICCYEQSNFRLDRYEDFKLHIDGAKKIFIDNILAVKDGKTYCIKQMIYQVWK